MTHRPEPPSQRLLLSLELRMRNLPLICMGIETVAVLAPGQRPEAANEPQIDPFELTQL